MYPIRFFDRAARIWPLHSAAECADQSVSYARLHAKVQALAAGLQALDPKTGSRIAIRAHNSIDHLWLACLAAS